MHSKVKNGLALTALALFPAAALATIPDPTWTGTYGNQWNDAFRGIVATDDGGTVSAGYIYLSQTGSRRLNVVRTDADGNEVWTYTWSDKSEGYDIVAAGDGGFIAVGYRSISGRNWDPFAIKLDADGNLVWSNNYGTVNQDYGEAIIRDAEGNFVIAGQANFSTYSDYQGYIVKIDADGNRIWDQLYSGGGMHRKFFDITLATDGTGYVVTGQDDSDWSNDMVVMKVGMGGAVAWTKTFNYPGLQAGNGITGTTDGGYAICGFQQSSGYDLLVKKVDSSGNPVWDYVLETSGTDYGTDILEMSDGSLIASGRSPELAGDQPSGILIEFAADGTLTDTRYFGGSAEDNIVGLAPTTDYSFVACGLTNSFGAGAYDSWVLSFGAGIPPAPLGVDMTLSGSTYHIGDTLVYDVLLQNNTSEQVQVNYKEWVRLPAGIPYTLTQTPMLLFGDGTAAGTMTHLIPPVAPLGDYTLFNEIEGPGISAIDSVTFSIE